MGTKKEAQFIYSISFEHLFTEKSYEKLLISESNQLCIKEICIWFERHMQFKGVNVCIRNFLQI